MPWFWSSNIRFRFYISFLRKLGDDILQMFNADVHYTMYIMYFWWRTISLHVKVNQLSALELSKTCYSCGTFGIGLWMVFKIYDWVMEQKYKLTILSAVGTRKYFKTYIRGLIKQLIWQELSLLDVKQHHNITTTTAFTKPRQYSFFTFLKFFAYLI